MKSTNFAISATFAVLMSAASFTYGFAAPLNATDPTATVDPNAQGLVQDIKARKTYADGSYTGGTYDAYYGPLQVTANIQGGRLVSVDVLKFPNHKSTSRAINRQALPILEQQVIRAQSARVNMVSGATLTSRAYAQSLYSALQQAGG
jgi:uncharacterized protein with FMN-binding domain